MNFIAASAKRLHEIRFLRFGVVGAGGFCVDMSVLWLMMHLVGLDKYSGRGISFMAAVTFTWWGNRMLTFRDRAAQTGLMREWMTFVTANAFGGLVNLGLYTILVSFAPSPANNPFLAVGAGVLAGLTFNFILSSRIVFRGSAR
ncbi:MAG TPA: GtrA family protein [Rhizomicrobium sp.]|jgi:putative flippase GtrA